MSLFSRSLTCFWLRALTPPRPFSLGTSWRKQHSLTPFPPTPSRRPILGTQSARPFPKHLGLPQSKREKKILSISRRLFHPSVLTFFSFVLTSRHPSGAVILVQKRKLKPGAIPFSDRTYCVADNFPVALVFTVEKLSSEWDGRKQIVTENKHFITRYNFSTERTENLSYFCISSI